MARGAAVAAITTLGLVSSLAAVAQSDPFEPLRRDMVDSQVRKRGIGNPAILNAMEEVPRHLFVPKANQPRAYDDGPVEFSPGQRIPQSYVSARMIELLELGGSERVLEIGTGSGYEAALLSEMAKEVYTIEINQSVADRARRKLLALGYDNIEFKIGDGYNGWSEKGPFDAILVTAAARRLPQPLFDQLAVGGRMVVAVGRRLVQELRVITKTADGPDARNVSLVKIEPMKGEVNRQED